MSNNEIGNFGFDQKRELSIKKPLTFGIFMLLKSDFNFDLTYLGYGGR
jgi:hypothetical protein